MMLIPTASQEDLDHHHRPEDERWSARRSRRAFIGTSLALAGFPLASIQPAIAADVSLRPTDTDDLGPFYPQASTPSENLDLTRITGHDAAAMGPYLYLRGRVMNPRGEPIPNALVEVWQANAAGRYTHPGDDNKAPIDPNFDGFARFRTDADGGYRLKTVYPGSYRSRTRHVHFDVRGQRTRVVTQMYFEGEPKNDKDYLLNAHDPEDRKTVISRRISPEKNQEPDAIGAEWNIVLAYG